MTIPIEEYAVIGDRETAALVSREGSIDWLCLPRFDSPSCFTALLGTREYGRWLLRPVGDSRATRRYRGHTVILETTHETDSGSVLVTDVMPLADETPDVVRVVEGISGRVEMEQEWIVRFDYGRIRPWVTHDRDEHGERITAVAGPERLTLRGTRLPRGADGRHTDRFVVEAGERHTFTMTWSRSFDPVPPPLEVAERLTVTAAQAEQWADECDYTGPYREAVLRSLQTLRLLSDTLTGGIVAAPTTSLPEDFGGERNWDYRYCWLRDASLTLNALLRAGQVETSRMWRDWLLRAAAGDPEDLQIMYTVDGGRRLPETALDHLPGYAGSRPVRIGNAAVDQRQTDVLGEVMIALHEARRRGLAESEDAWALEVALIEDLATHWDEPDNGLWEVRGPLRHFTHSRVMVWAAFDRAVRAVEEFGRSGPVERWRELRERVRAEILEHGWNAERGTFTQHYDTSEVDASLLLIPLVGFLPGDDPRVLGTIAAVEHDLLRDGLVLRYRTETGVDGLRGTEHPFLACSWWLVSAYADAGRLEDARHLMDRLLGLLNDVGLISEEYDPVGRRMAGNFPQAFSHLALVGAAFHLEEATRRAEALSGSAGAP